MKDFLSVTEIEELKQDHRAERESRFADRLKSILMLNSGLSYSKTARYLLLDETTVRRYLQRYLDGGLENLCTDEHTGRSCWLTVEQLDALDSELRRKIYPTTDSIIEFVEHAFGLSYSISGIMRVLVSLGFSYKKPQPIPGKADAKAQKNFLRMLEDLQASKLCKDPILYGDSTHPQHNSHAAYGWLPRGETTELKTNTGRKRVTLNGVLDAESHEIIVQEDSVLNAEHTVTFFKKIERHYLLAKTIYLILDNAGYYKGKVIKEYLRHSKIQILYLPPYAPNLNLIERVWKFFKKKVLANRYFESFLEFRQECLRFFSKRVWRSYKAELASLLTNNFQILGV